MRIKRKIISILLIIGVISAATFLEVASLSAQNQEYLLLGGGWGHGAGMSQHGAYGRAADGQSYEEILDFYYQNSKLTEIEEIQDMRILLGSGSSVALTPDGINRIALDGATLARPDPRTQIRISLANDIWQVTTSGGSLCPDGGCRGEALRLHFATGSSVRVSSTGHSYLHGRFTLTKVDENEMRIVLDSLKMEDYMYGIAELPGHWPIEAQKAQAVAARSYAFERIMTRRSNSNWNPNFDLYAGTRDQVYSGNSQELSPAADLWREAVDSTSNQILVDSNSRPITAFYSSSNGGYSSRGSVVFQNDLPYIVAKPDSFDAYENRNAKWRRTYSIQELSQWLNLDEDIQIGILSKVTIGEGVSESGRIDLARVTLRGTRGTKEITGREFYLAINSGISKTRQPFSRRLLSTRISLETAPGSLSDSELDAINSATLLPSNELPTKPVGALEKFIYDREQDLNLTGWAFDGELGNDASLEVRIYNERKLVTVLAPGEFRPDIQTQRGYGITSGFIFELPSIPQEAVTYCAIAEDTTAKERTFLGCLNHGFRGGGPFGEILEFKQESNGNVRIQGWAIDPSDSVSPAGVQIFVNGSLFKIEQADLTLEELGDNMVGKDRGFDVSFTPAISQGLQRRGGNSVCVSITSSLSSSAASQSLGCLKLEN